MAQKILIQTTADGQVKVFQDQQGKVLKADVTIPVGTKQITDTALTDVRDFETAQVVDPNLVAENIKEGTSVLGIVGTATTYAPREADDFVKVSYNEDGSIDETQDAFYVGKLNFFKKINYVEYTKIVKENSTLKILGKKYTSKYGPQAHISIEIVLSSFPFLEKLPPFNLDEVEFFYGLGTSCPLITEVPDYNVKNATDFTWAGAQTFYGSDNIERVHLKNINAKIDLSNLTKMTREALLEVIGNLMETTTTKVLRLGETLKAKLTPDDIKLATDKGWTVE